MANLTRRQWLKVGLAVGGMVTFGLSYRDVAKRAIDGLLNGDVRQGNARPHLWQCVNSGGAGANALAAKPTTNHRHDAMLRLLDTVRYPRPG
ncbi:tetrathionate reductase subunit A [Salmonella enterica subsp. arizonae]|uniref:Tetrathionate reductase subunit A n=1 Tax=Salmonella enterica subsp. arizonae TaxID=59203 RepID=A0A379TBF0_SALER|nr:tetrathionate reductase subunit A [Salmonella enterica subsp. arizonae]